MPMGGNCKNPIGIGALYLYWKKKRVDLPAGAVCAAGFLVGGYFGSLIAIRIDSADLRALFGLFLMVAAILLWHQSHERQSQEKTDG